MLENGRKANNKLTIPLKMLQKDTPTWALQIPLV